MAAPYSSTPACFVRWPWAPAATASAVGEMADPGQALQRAGQVQVQQRDVRRQLGPRQVLDPRRDRDQLAVRQRGHDAAQPRLHDLALLTERLGLSSALTRRESGGTAFNREFPGRQAWTIRHPWSFGLVTAAAAVAVIVPALLLVYTSAR
jgi:hypothetical protein